jgi:endonuclease/exonuclease/phosphatase (EEP) superfamily protein YafD
LIAKLFKWAYNIFTIVTLLALLAPYLSPSVFWLISIVALFLPYFIFIHIIAFIYFLFKKRKLAILSFLILLLCIPTVIRTLTFQLNEPLPTKINVKILSYNLFGLKMLKQEIERTDGVVIADFNRELSKIPHPDVLCVQEANPYAKRIIEEFYNLPYKHHIDNKDLVLYSRYTMIDKGAVEYGIVGSKLYWADLEIGKIKVRVYCVHLESNKVSAEADELFRDGQIQQRKSWKKALDLLIKYGRSARDRTYQVDALTEHFKESPYPVILIGDFNDTPTSYTYRALSSNLNDAFQRNYNGIGSTYSGNIPFLRIDYIFCDKDIIVNQFDVHKLKWSDHYPVFASISLDSLER